MPVVPVSVKIKVREDVGKSAGRRVGKGMCVPFGDGPVTHEVVFLNWPVATTAGRVPTMSTPSV